MREGGDMESSLYYGNSMFRVFTPGDKLLLRRIPFEDLRVGDIVAVEAKPTSYVHRVIEIGEGGAVTQGDNNASPDEALVTPSSEWRLVVEYSDRHGRVHPVAGGEDGMRAFRRHQRRRHFRCILSRCASWIWPLAFWRLPAGRVVEFQGRRVAYFRNIPVASLEANGRIHYFSWLKHLLFKVRVPAPKDVNSQKRTF